jgi:hypothetical protein
MENRYELRKGGRLGPGKDDAKEILVLNRVQRRLEVRGGSPPRGEALGELGPRRELQPHGHARLEAVD